MSKFAKTEYSYQVDKREATNEEHDTLVTENHKASLMLKVISITHLASFLPQNQCSLPNFSLNFFYKMLYRPF